MIGEDRIFVPVLMAGAIACLTTALISWRNPDLPPDCLWRWLRAFLIAWPAGAIAASSPSRWRAKQLRQSCAASTDIDQQGLNHLVIEAQEAADSDLCFK